MECVIFFIFNSNKIPLFGKKKETQYEQPFLDIQKLEMSTKSTAKP